MFDNLTCYQIDTSWKKTRHHFLHNNPKIRPIKLTTYLIQCLLHPGSMCTWQRMYEGWHVFDFKCMCPTTISLVGHRDRLTVPLNTTTSGKTLVQCFSQLQSLVHNIIFRCNIVWADFDGPWSIIISTTFYGQRDSFLWDGQINSELDLSLWLHTFLLKLNTEIECLA